MFHTRSVLALAAGLALVTGCASGVAAPGTTAPASVPPASQGPATTAAPAPGSDLTVDAFMDKVVAAQAAVKTYTITMSMDTTLMDKPSSITMKGAIDQSDRSNINMSMAMDMAGMKMKVLKIDGDMYLQLDATGGKWMKVPKSQMAQYDTTTDSADITAGMNKARSAMKKVELVGPESVDGVPTTHYRIVVDAAGLSQITGSDAKISGDTFNYDVWLDEAMRTRKVAMDVKAEADGADVPLKVDARMGGFDEPVDITAPDKGDLVEMGG